MKILIFVFLFHFVTSKPQVYDEVKCDLLGKDYTCVPSDMCLLKDCKDDIKSIVDPRAGFTDSVNCETLSDEKEAFRLGDCSTPRSESDIQVCCKTEYVITPISTTQKVVGGPLDSCRALSMTHSCVPSSQCRVIDCKAATVDPRSADSFDCKNGPPADSEEYLKFDCTDPRQGNDPVVVCCDRNFIDHGEVNNIPPAAPKPQVIFSDPTSICGAHFTKGFSTRIITQANSETYFGEWPNMCAIFQNGEFLTAASLITPGIVLTAGTKTFNFSSYDDLFVRCGDWNLNVTGDSNIEQLPHQEIKVENIIVHPNFDPDFSHNNIAVVKMTAEFATKDHIFPACLPKSKDVFSEVMASECIGMGWGRAAAGSMPSDVLRQSRLPLVDQSECAARHGKPTLNEAIICAGGIQGEDTCEGDGGGPLMCPKSTNGTGLIYVQVGVTSHGVGCGRPIPGFYTSIAKEICFINFATQCLASNAYDKYYNYDAECENWLGEEKSVAQARFEDGMKQLSDHPTGVFNTSARSKIKNAKNSLKNVNDLETVKCGRK